MTEQTPKYLEKKFNINDVIKKQFAKYHNWESNGFLIKQEDMEKELYNFLLYVEAHINNSNPFKTNVLDEVKRDINNA